MKFQLLEMIGTSAGLAFAITVWLIGRRLSWICDCIDRHTRMELVRMIFSPDSTEDDKNILRLQIKEVETAIEFRKNKI
jgi:hypothetical protein